MSSPSKTTPNKSPTSSPNGSPSNQQPPTSSPKASSSKASSPKASSPKAASSSQLPPTSSPKASSPKAPSPKAASTSQLSPTSSPKGSPPSKGSPKPSTSKSPPSILKSPTAPGSPKSPGSRSPRVSIGATPGPSGSPGLQTIPEERYVECPVCPDDDDKSGKDAGDKYQVIKPDAINTEYLYYSSALREVGPALTNELDRQLIIPWIKKLFRPEYHSTLLRDKRNKFLLYLTLTILNDEVYGIFRMAPPEGALPHLADLQQEEFPPAEWEQDTMWEDALRDIPEEYRFMECSVHNNEVQCFDDDDVSSKLYDEEFRYFLYLARPYATLVKKSKDRTRAAAWLQKLCTIQITACLSMKKLRNEYITSLLGYLQDLRLVGPFKLFPYWKSLPPLAELADLTKKKESPLHPCSEETSEFIAAQPLPNEGAFCYIAITGELLESSFGELE